MSTVIPIPLNIPLDQRPPETSATPNTTYTFGDMHGNVLFFINNLLTIGVLTVIGKNKEEKDTTYKNLVVLLEEITKDDRDLTLPEQDPDIPIQPRSTLAEILDYIERFEQILRNLQLTNATNVHIRLLGDILADRGHCDYLMLLVLVKLSLSTNTLSKNKNITFEIIFSNHDEMLIRRFFRGLATNDELRAILNAGLRAWGGFRPGGNVYPETKDDSLAEDYEKKKKEASYGLYLTASLTRMLNWIDMDSTGSLRKNVIYMLKQYYMPNCKLISYSIHAESTTPVKYNIVLAMHAPCSLYIIPELITQFQDQLKIYLNHDSINKLSALPLLQIDSAKVLENIANLTQSIDALNAFFTDPRNNRFMAVFLKNYVKTDLATPLDQLLWSRIPTDLKGEEDFLNREKFTLNDGTEVLIKHGHDIASGHTYPVGLFGGRVNQDTSKAKSTNDYRKEEDHNATAFATQSPRASQSADDELTNPTNDNNSKNSPSSTM